MSTWAFIIRNWAALAGLAAPRSSLANHRRIRGLAAALGASSKIREPSPQPVPSQTARSSGLSAQS